MAVFRTNRRYGRSLVSIVFAIYCFSNSRADDLLLNVNVKKPIAVVSDKFLSITIDPIAFINSNDLRNIERSTNMAEALAPAYVRIGGPQSNSYIFKRESDQQENNSAINYTLTDANWSAIHRWAEKSGLDVIASIAPRQSDNRLGTSSWDTSNALNLISFSNHMGFNANWQLGYECQTYCSISGTDLGKDLKELHNLLGDFPRYADSLLIGPDVIAYKSRDQQQYLQDFLEAAGPALSALTWHPNFAGLTLQSEGFSMHHDNLAIEKNNLLKIASRSVAKKPLWIAESKAEECKRHFLGALVWTRRLGNAAKLGFQVLMRQPDQSKFFDPTPDYWVSVLHKKLIGTRTLDTKITMGNRTHVYVYAHCARPTENSKKPSLAIFGINLTPSNIAMTLRGLKITTVHNYILFPGFDAENRLFSETVLLNDEPLSLTDDNEIPEIVPAITDAEYIDLPSGAIGFYVIPGLNIKACVDFEKQMGDDVSRKTTKNLDDLQSEDITGEYDDDSNGSLNEKRDTAKEDNGKSSRRFRAKEEKDGEAKLKRIDHRREMEKLLRRKTIPEGRSTGQRGRNVHAVSDNIKGESPSAKLHRKINSEKESRSKNWEHNARLPVRKKRLGQIFKQRNANIDRSVNTDKVIEALTLMTKVENAMNDMESADSDVLRIVNGKSGSGGSYGLEDDKDAALLNEVLNTKRARETNVPLAIEDQLKALYNLLSKEEDNNEGQLQTRYRRDLEKRMTYDPLSVRPSPIRKRIKNDDVKERLLERRLRRKEELKKDSQFTFVNPRIADSGDNNFYGFAIREPIKGFPNGDVYVKAYETTEKTSNKDKLNSDTRSLSKRSKSQANVEQKQDVIWTPADSSHLFSSANANEDNTMTRFNKKENLKDYSEYWAAGPVDDPNRFSQNIQLKQQSINNDDRSQQELFHKERLIKGSPAFGKPNEYPITPQPSKKHAEAEEMVPMGELTYEVVTITPEVPNADQEDFSLEVENIGTIGNLRRSKRQCDDLEEVLDREMMLQQYNDMDEVQRRVIRLDETGKEIIDRGSGIEEVVEGTSVEQGEEILTEYPFLALEDEPEKVATIVQSAPSTSERSQSLEVDRESQVPILLETSGDRIDTSRLARQIEMDLNNETETQFFLDSEREVRNAPSEPGAEEEQETADRNGVKPDQKESVSLDTEDLAVEEISAVGALSGDSGAKERRSTTNRDKSPKTRTTGSSDTKKKTEKEEAARPALLNKSSKPRERTNLKNRLDSVRSKARQSSAKVPDVKDKEQRRTQKTEDAAKTREARIAARSGALASLRRENEGKRRETTSTPAPPKAAANEQQKKRNEQIGKLREKLRTKRAKMLQQYREELTEAVHESLDSKIGNRPRRASSDLMDKSSKGIETKTNSTSSAESKPINVEKTASNSKESSSNDNADKNEEGGRSDYSSEIYDEYDYYDTNEKVPYNTDVMGIREPVYWVTDPRSLQGGKVPDPRYAPYYVYPAYNYHGVRPRPRRGIIPARAEVLNGPLFFSIGLDNLGTQQDNDYTEIELEKSSIEQSSVEDSSSEEIEEETQVSDKDFSKTKQLPTPYTVNFDAKIANLISKRKSDDSAEMISGVDLKYTRKDQRAKRQAAPLHDISEEIDGPNDKVADNIWSDTEEIKREENILEEYIREKNQIIDNFKRTRENLKNYVQIANEQKILDEREGSRKVPANVNSLDETSDKEKKSVSDKSGIQSLLADAIPKLQEAVTGGLEKARNLTNCLEDFIENFDDKFNATMSVENPGNSKNETCVDDGKLKFNIFHTMVGSVKKFFGLLSEVSRSLHH